MFIDVTDDDTSIERVFDASSGHRQRAAEFASGVVGGRGRDSEHRERGRGQRRPNRCVTTGLRADRARARALVTSIIFSFVRYDYYLSLGTLIPMVDRKRKKEKKWTVGKFRLGPRKR